MTSSTRHTVALFALSLLAPLADLHFAAAPPAIQPSQQQRADALPHQQDCAGNSSKVASPDGTQFAYAAGCSAASATAAPAPSEPADLLILDSAGKQISRSAELDDRKLGESCSPEDVQWLDNRRVGLACEYEPLLRQYFVVDAATGNVEQKYTGLSFAWSPDRQTLARVDIARQFGSPQGDNSCLYFNEQPAYPTAKPKDCQPHPKNSYQHIHTFLSRPEWSPDSRRVAVVVKIFNWEYSDPFGRYFDGTASNERYYLAIASPGQPAVGYALALGYPLGSERNSTLEWLSNSRLSLDGQTFDLDARPPAPIP